MIRTFFGSMTARIFLILVSGTIISGALVLGLAASERKDLETRIRMHHTAERVEQIIRMLDSVPPQSRLGLSNIAREYGVWVDFANTSIPASAPDTEMSLDLKQSLGIGRPVTVLERNSQDCPSFKPRLPRPGPGARYCETVLTKLHDGTPVRLDVTHRERFNTPYRGHFIRDLLLFLSGLSLIALIIAHMATKPLRRLAQAANNLSHDIGHAPLPVDKGSKEVREASLAFNSMQTSVRNHIEERTYMLAAIAHDLQTPLTRLRLRLEKVDDPELRAKLVADLGATQDMVREGLDFARSIGMNEPFERVDIDSLIEALCNDALEAGCEVTFDGRIGQPMMASPHALRRCLANLLDNACKYGKFAHVSVKRKDNIAVITIIDGGPGIPEEQFESVFQPFHRLESSRSRVSGGTGLGLTIARIIAEKHKGRILLGNMASADLGLMVTVELPLA